MQTYFVEPSGIFKNSAPAMSQIIGRHFPTGSILDLTFGQGVFYKETTRTVIGCDLLSKPRIKVQADCRRAPFADSSFDLVVLDPPFKTGHRFYDSRYGQKPLEFNTEQKVTRVYLEAIPEAIRIARQGMIVKLTDGSDGHRVYMRHIEIAQYVADLTGLPVFDYALLIRSERATIIPPQGTRSRFFPKPVSYFLIWKWIEKGERFRAPRY